MFLESLFVVGLHSKTLKALPWVDPWVITNELLVLQDQGAQALKTTMLDYPNTPTHCSTHYAPSRRRQ